MFARRPLKKLDPDEEALLRLVQRWRDEALKAGRAITRRLTPSCRHQLLRIARACNDPANGDSKLSLMFSDFVF
jgi:hypothetical protein